LHFLVHAIDIFARAIYCIRVIYDVVFNLNQWLQQCLVDTLMDAGEHFLSITKVYKDQ
jgi:hypothetical protein